MQAGEIEICQKFFNLEYNLNLMLHRVKTPLLVWGQGLAFALGDFCRLFFWHWQ